MFQEKLFLLRSWKRAESRSRSGPARLSPIARYDCRSRVMTDFRPWHQRRDDLALPHLRQRRRLHPSLPCRVSVPPPSAVMAAGRLGRLAVAHTQPGRRPTPLFALRELRMGPPGRRSRGEYGAAGRSAASKPRRTVPAVSDWDAARRRRYGPRGPNTPSLSHRARLALRYAA